MKKLKRPGDSGFQNLRIKELEEELRKARESNMVLTIKIKKIREIYLRGKGILD